MRAYTAKSLSAIAVAVMLSLCQTRSVAALPSPVWSQKTLWQNANNPHLRVSYHDHEVVNGSDLSLAHVQEAPQVAYRGSETYTLMLLDPDAPSHEQPENRNFIHWLVTNIPRDAVQSGQRVLEYAPPAPPPGSGFHRYIFRLYSQGEDTIQVTAPASRAKFSPEEFAKQYNLGDPLALLFFKAKQDRSV